MASTARKVVANIFRQNSAVKHHVFPRCCISRCCSTAAQKHISPKTGLADPGFGLFFDIDGVIIRGKKLLPGAREAFQMLTDSNGKFWIPTIFVTNAGNMLRQTKAMQLSEYLGIEISQEQVIMSHSPLKMFTQFLDKRVLVSGQGPAKEIAKNLGFTKVTTIETLRQSFPTLDMVDHKRRKTDPCEFEKFFPRIDAIIMFGEPIRWETNLQLILDVLLTDGYPSDLPEVIPYPHIPILACNMDLVWMAESSMPRLAHGCFMHCLEALYNKLSGHKMKYTALLGKPSTLTYYHAESVLQQQAREMGYKGITEIYCVGDNPDVDVYGANLFNQVIHKHPHRTVHDRFLSEMTENGPSCMTIEERKLLGVKNCKSVLVCTGVYNGNGDLHDENAKQQHEYNQRDNVMDPDLRKPNMMVRDVLQAVKNIFTDQRITGVS